jgi:hypothetical protein
MEGSFAPFAESLANLVVKDFAFARLLTRPKS